MRARGGAARVHEAASCLTIVLPLILVTPACCAALQFVELRRMIQRWRHHSHFIPTLPGRTLFAPAGCIGEAFLERRRIALQAFLRSIAGNPRLLELPDVLNFLGFPEHMSSYARSGAGQLMITNG